MCLIDSTMECCIQGDFMNVTTYQAIAMIVYFVLMIMLGLLAYVRTNTLDDYMLGGRQL